MSWYDDDYRRRAAITVINTGGTSTVDANVVIPDNWDEFWNIIDTDGEHLRVTAGDGYTLLDYSVDDGSGGSFNKTTRAGRIQIDAVAAPGTADEVLCFWLYFAADSVADGSTATTIASPETGYIDRGAPGWHRMSMQPPTPGAARPRYLISKDSNDEDYVWVNVSEFLERSSSPYAKRRLHEEVAVLTLTAQDENGSAYAAMVDAEDVRFVDSVSGRRQTLIRIPVAAGVDGTNYTVKFELGTRIPFKATLHRKVRAQFGVRVVDLLEPAT